MAYNKETGMYEGYIYKIYNDINDKVYIGQTIFTIEHRFACHKSSARNDHDNMIIHRAMNKHGEENFHVRELYKTEKATQKELIEHLNEKEIYYIEKYNSITPDGYNITIGGNSATYFRGYIYQYDLNCNLLNVYSTAKEASISTGIGEAAIHKCCLNKSRTAGGYIFLREGTAPYKANTKEVLVNQYSKSDVYIQTYESILNVSKVLGLDKSSITNCCRGKRYKTVGGYKWFYANDPNQPDKTKIIIN